MISCHDLSLNSSVSHPRPPVFNGGNLPFFVVFSFSTNRKPSSASARKVVFSSFASRCARAKRSSAISIVVFTIWLPIFHDICAHINPILAHKIPVDTMSFILHYMRMNTSYNTEELYHASGLANTNELPSPSITPSTLTPVSQNFAESREISSNSTLKVTQDPDHQQSNRKSAPGIFAQKISPEQRSILFEWLADHTYDEVVELVAAEPPEGFGIKVGKSTLCRFHKANFYEIDKLRQSRLESRTCESLHRQDAEIYREVIRDAYT